MSVWGELDSTLVMFDCLRDIIQVSVALEATLKQISKIVEQDWQISMSIWSESDSTSLMFNRLGEIIQVSIVFESTVK
jgi:hypothetical protein